MLYVIVFAASLATAPAVTSAPATELSAKPASSAPAGTNVNQYLAKSSGAAPASSLPGGYVPKTKHDNSPYRFDMQQNGRRMTAAEFEAWMKSRGIRVATGKPAGQTTAAPAAVSTASAGGCKATATITC